MKKQTRNFIIATIIAIIIILSSTPLGHAAVQIIYGDQNLSSEYIPILNGFIHSILIVGILVFAIGVTNVILNKDK